MTFDLKKILTLVCVLALPSFAVWLGAGEALRVSQKPSEYIGLLFSILAASLFATIAIVGDPANLMRGGWRSAWEDAKRIQLRLMRLVYLFVLYLIVLVLLVLSEIIEFKSLEDFYLVHDALAWSSILAFLCSLWLPFEIRSIQVARLESEISQRRSSHSSNKNG